MIAHFKFLFQTKLVVSLCTFVLPDPFHLVSFPGSWLHDLEKKTTVGISVEMIYDAVVAFLTFTFRKLERLAV